ncbi:MAG: hypothetical protein JOZ51_11770, partial [Chloroflexi bacterium]|nr:hypothetical protein [Chloroflexota bacterium]
RVDPFYRDVDDLLARAESLSGTTAERSTSRRPAVWLTGAAIAALLLGGGVYGWNALRSPNLAEQPPTGTAGTIVGANPTGVIAATATATPLVVADVPTTGASAAPAASEPAGGTLPTAEVVPTTPPPPTEIPPSPTSEQASPTALPTEAPPPTEVPPPPTEVPPTPVPPTAVPPTAAPPRPTQAPAPTTPPAALPAGGLEGGQVLDGDNFSNPASGWPNLQEANYTLGYRDGAYVITSQPNTGAIFAYGSPLGASNAIIGADVIPVRGAAGLNFGPSNNYRFLISADGRFRVEQRGGRVIVGPTPSNAIRAGRNRLVLAVVGTRASVYANGALLANFNVPTPLAGTTYGFVVVPGPNGGEGIFDSLTVRTLPR